VTLGKRIAARRRALGLSQNELARRAEVNHPTLHKIEAGQRLNPSVGVVLRIARALGTDVESLCGTEGNAASGSGAGESEAGHLAIVEELQTLRRRLDALMAALRAGDGRRES